jgi:hypothetical protein
VRDVGQDRVAPIGDGGLDAFGDVRRVSLLCSDAYLRDRHVRSCRYDQLESPDIGDLLHEVDRDPVAVFWGWPSRLRRPQSAGQQVPELCRHQYRASPVTCYSRW